MNKTIAVIGAIVAGIGLFIGGFFFGREPTPVQSNPNG